MNGVSEKELITRCRGGDRSAYVPLVKAYSRRIFGMCLGMLGNVHDAEDISQQALLKGLANIEELRDQEQFGAWIGQIARNLCIDFIRKRKRTRSSLAERTAASENDSKEYPELKKALTKLPEEHRLALMLYYFDGQSIKAMAETLAISEVAAQTRLSRARKRLRRILETERGA